MDFREQLKKVLKGFNIRGLKERKTLEADSTTDEVKEFLATLIKELKRIGG